MYLVLLGVVFVVLKFMEVAPVADWAWWIVLTPFGLALLWWMYSDATGLTKKREMDKMDDRKEQRRRKAFAALGLDYRKSSKDKKRAEAWQRSRQAQISKVEGKREAERQRHADTIARSRFASEQASSQLSELDPAQQAPTKK